MGDARFERPYRAVRDAEDRARSIGKMDDETLAAALGGASRGQDPLLANVLATALQNRLRQLHAVLDNLGEGVLLMDALGACISANVAAGRLLRRDPDDLRGLPMHTLVHPLCQAPHCPLVDWRVETVQVDDDEFATGDGGRIAIAYTISRTIQDDEPAGAVLVFRDMSEHRKMMSSLAKLAALFDASIDAVYTITPTGTILSWNKGAERLYGYAAGEIVGKPISMLMPPGAQGEERLLTELVIRQGNPLTFETTRMRKDRSPVEVSLSISPTRVGSLIDGALVVARDVSVKKREQALLARILDAAPQAMIAAMPDGHILFANAKAEKLFGSAPGELVRRSIDDLVPARLRTRHSVHRSAYVNDPHERPMGVGLELRAVRKDGTEIPVEISLSPVESDMGVVTIAAIVDLSSRDEA